MSEPKIGDVVHVEFDWINEHGMCEDCGDLPANYCAPDLIFTHMKGGEVTDVQQGHKLCPICAALWASHGEPIQRLWREDDECEPDI